MNSISQSPYFALNGTVVDIAWEYQPKTQLSRNNPSNINHMLTTVSYE